MAVDRARNTLRQARELTIGGTVRDFVGRRDRDDLYRVSLGSRSQFSLQLTGVQRKASVKAELFTVKDGAIGKIGRINFSSLSARQRQNLTRLGSTSGAIDLTLNSGQYYLRISPQRGESRYRLTVNAAAIASPAPNPLSPSPGTSPTPNPSPSPGTSPSPTPDPTPIATSFTRSWLRQFGTSGNDYAYGTATDSSGNVYVSGTTPNAINDSTTDAFVAKYDASGNPVWQRSFGSETLSDTAFDLAVDAQGNYYVTGATNINLSSFRSDGFVAKYAADGRQLWWQSIDSTDAFLSIDAASSIAIDTAGNAYVAGFTVTSPFGADRSRAFVAKYGSTDGGEQWRTLYNGSAADAAADVALDAAGDVYITGIRDANLTTSNPNEPFTGGDAFVAKFNNAGVRQWDQTLAAANGQDYGRSIAVTADGNAYITGQTDGTLGGQTSAGGRDGFVARYRPDGTLVWAKQFGTASLDEGQGIAIAPNGSIYVTGETSAALFGQPAAGGSDAFFAQFAPNGDLLGSQQIGTAQDDEAYNLAIDSSGNLYIVGQTLGTFPGEGSAGSYDAWIAKYTPT